MNPAQTDPLPWQVNSSAEEWSHARGRLVAFGRRCGLQMADAQDMAQYQCHQLLTRRRWSLCPLTLATAIGWTIRRGRRYSVHVLRPGDSASRRRAAMADKLPPRPTRSSVPSGATMAEAAERLGVPLATVQEAFGLPSGGPVAVALTDRPAAQPPLRGCPGLATATDPNPASRERARLRCANDWRRVAGLPPLAE